MKTIEELINKKPETMKEKFKDLWFDFTCYYPSRVKDGFNTCCRFFRNLRKYWSFLVSDFDFDFSCMEILILKKLSYMADYFRTARITENSVNIYNQINLVIKIGEIITEKEQFTSPEKYGGKYGVDFIGYVNTRNYKRFLDSKIDNDELMKTELRKRKARLIFYKILEQYSDSWWD